MKRRADPFTRLDTLAEALLRRAATGESGLVWLQARWNRIVGEPLARKIAPESLDGKNLTLALLDPSWKKPVQATLPELERKLAREMPELAPRITLRG